jgi:hypothetical protein
MMGKVNAMQKKIVLMAVSAVTFLMPLVTLADDTKSYDGRLEGYGDKSVTLQDASGTGLTWLLLVGLGVLALGVLFKNSNRSHLD